MLTFPTIGNSQKLKLNNQNDDLKMTELSEFVSHHLPTVGRCCKKYGASGKYGAAPNFLKNMERLQIF